ncbi:MAG: hypothetical protein K2X98_06600 [Alphaproteobacteria bacterium]|nr:hypothetical protein [Alphaproteobacteria bacterium]
MSHAQKKDLNTVNKVALVSQRMNKIAPSLAMKERVRKKIAKVLNKIQRGKKDNSFTFEEAVHALNRIQDDKLESMAFQLDSDDPIRGDVENFVLILRDFVNAESVKKRTSDILSEIDSYEKQGLINSNGALELLRNLHPSYFQPAVDLLDPSDPVRMEYEALHKTLEGFAS